MMFSREPFIYRFLRNIIIPILLGIILVTPIYSQYKFSYRLGLGLGFTKPTKFNESLSEQELSSIGSMWFPINYDFSVNVYPSIRLGYKKLSTSLITYNRSSENYIQNTIDELRKQNKTIIIIAHRLSTVVNADKIVVLEEGKVIEEGNHESLFEKRDKYYQLWKQQFPIIEQYAL